MAEALRPPYTAGMSAPEVIEEFHSAQNELDLSKMGASFARGVENPYEMEVLQPIRELEGETSL